MTRTDGLYRRGKYYYFKYKSTDGIWCERATRSCNYPDAKRIRTQFLSDLQEGKLPNERAKGWRTGSTASHPAATLRKPASPGASYGY
jgi:hypothetical protein